MSAGVHIEPIVVFTIPMLAGAVGKLPAGFRVWACFPGFEHGKPVVTIIGQRERVK